MTDDGLTGGPHGSVTPGRPGLDGGRASVGAGKPVEAVTIADDPLHHDARLEEYFGERYVSVRAFAELLADQGVLRGLIGPRELGRIWERHILNSAAVVPFLAPGVVADVGSGAGLPGLVIAAMEPHRSVVLIEPMERRCAWLFDASRELNLDNVTVVRGRAEDVADVVDADVITARAVASVDKLVKWCSPLLRPGGELVFLKGRTAPEEIERAKYVLRKHKFVGEVVEAPTLEGLEPTTVVRLRRP